MCSPRIKSFVRPLARVRRRTTRWIRSGVGRSRVLLARCWYFGDGRFGRGADFSVRIDRDGNVKIFGVVFHKIVHAAGSGYGHCGYLLAVGLVRTLLARVAGLSSVQAVAQRVGV